MLASDFFTPARLKEMRDEILQQGFVADQFLASSPDAPVFGLNLACLYPFPVETLQAYDSLAAQLSALDAGVYVYPFWETHVTIATFINFTQHQSQTPQQLAEINNLTRRIVAQIEREFTSIKAFDLLFDPPIISRKAAIVPLSDASGTITEIRNRVAENLSRAPDLEAHLKSVGLNIPRIVHSTIMRFKNAPKNSNAFLEKFDEISGTVPRLPMRVKEIYITTETKPYMREGEIIHRFRLVD